jgi:hypothetical protein
MSVFRPLWRVKRTRSAHREPCEFGSLRQKGAFAGEFAPVPKYSWREQAGKPAGQILHRKGRDGGQGETRFAKLDRR